MVMEHSHRVTLVAAAADPISLLFFFFWCVMAKGEGEIHVTR